MLAFSIPAAHSLPHEALAIAVYTHTHTHTHVIRVPSYLCSVLFARAPVLGHCFFVSVNGLPALEPCHVGLFHSVHTHTHTHTHRHTIRVNAIICIIRVPALKPCHVGLLRTGGP